MADTQQEILGELRALRRDYDEISIGLRLQSSSKSEWQEWVTAVATFVIVAALAYALGLALVSLWSPS